MFSGAITAPSLFRHTQFIILTPSSSTHNLQMGLLQEDVGDLETLRDVEDYSSQLRTYPFFSFSIFPFNAYWIIPPFLKIR